MPDFGRWGANGGDPSLNAIARTDRYPRRAGLRAAGVRDRPGRRRAGRPAGRLARRGAQAAGDGSSPQRDAEIVAAARARLRADGHACRWRSSARSAAALLCLGGFGAVVYGAGPGDALYGLRTMLFGEQQVTRDDQVTLAAQTEMQQVQQLIDQGDWDAAAGQAADRHHDRRRPSRTMSSKQELLTQWTRPDGQGRQNATRMRRCRPAAPRAADARSAATRDSAAAGHLDAVADLRLRSRPLPDISPPRLTATSPQLPRPRSTSPDHDRARRDIALAAAADATARRAQPTPTTTTPARRSDHRPRPPTPTAITPTAATAAR